MRNVFDVLFVVVREDDRVVLDVIFTIEAEVHHERRTRELSLAKVRGLMAAKILLIEEHAHGMTEVGVDYDVVTVDLFAARKFDAAGAAAIKKHARRRVWRCESQRLLHGQPRQRPG